MEEIKEKQKKQEELSRLHEGTHIDPNKKEMFRDANIESVALNPAEQERMIQKYKQEIGENKQQQRSTGHPNVPATSHLHRPLSQDTRPSGNNPEAPLSTTHRPKNHVYDTLPDKLPSSSLGHHSASAGNILSHQNSQPGNIQSGEEAMLMKANVKAWEMNEQGQEERLKEFKRLRDEKREVARVVNLSGSCVDPPDSHHPESRSPPIYDNMPGGGNKQPTVMAIAPPSQDSHQFVMGSRVEFSDPPRYGEIRWMGNFPQVNGLIVGVELVSSHCT